MNRIVDVIDVLNTYREKMHGMQMDEFMLAFILNKTPDADAAPVVHAHLEAKYNPEELSSDTPCKCSNCGAEEPICFISDWDFCPHCGAKMDKTEENKVTK